MSTRERAENGHGVHTPRRVFTPMPLEVLESVGEKVPIRISPWSSSTLWDRFCSVYRFRERVSNIIGISRTCVSQSVARPAPLCSRYSFVSIMYRVGDSVGDESNVGHTRIPTDIRARNSRLDIYGGCAAASGATPSPPTLDARKQEPSEFCKNDARLAASRLRGDEPKGKMNLRRGRKKNLLYMKLL